MGGLPLPCGDIGFLAIMAMASPSGPVSEFQHFGKRAKPVKKMRFIPKARAFEIARSLQGTKGCSVSVL